MSRVLEHTFFSRLSGTTTLNWAAPEVRLAHHRLI